MPELTGAIMTSSAVEQLPYPGRIVKRKEKDKTITKFVIK